MYPIGRPVSTSTATLLPRRFRKADVAWRNDANSPSPGQPVGCPEEPREEGLSGGDDALGLQLAKVGGRWGPIRGRLTDCSHECGHADNAARPFTSGRLPCDIRLRVEALMPHSSAPPASD